MCGRTELEALFVAADEVFHPALSVLSFSWKIPFSVKNPSCALVYRAVGAGAAAPGKAWALAGSVLLPYPLGKNVTITEAGDSVKPLPV